MVTLCDAGIKVVFYLYSRKIEVSRMAENRKELYSSQLQEISFEEYENTELEFISNSFGDRLYMDGIDLLPAGLCEVDMEGNMYLKPNRKGKRYSIFIDTADVYAMHVGDYEFKIVHDGKEFFLWFHIIPKNVSSVEWSIMQNELEGEIRGLSTDIIRKNIAFENELFQAVSSQKLYKFFVIKSHFNNILAALIDLKDRLNYRVEKEYRQELLYHATSIDFVTVKDYLHKGTREEKYLVPKQKYNYDLPENRWLKKIIGIYENELHLFYDSIDKYMTILHQELDQMKQFADAKTASIMEKERILEELSRYRKHAKAILNISELIKNQDWYKEIGQVRSDVIPQILLCDIRYSAFYKMYKELLLEGTDIKWEEACSYAWKSSSKMYEVWCFIKVCRFLISDELGFEASGWIFDRYQSEHIQIPDLISGTCVEFRKGEFRILMHYDSVMGRSIAATSMNNPVFSKKNHVRPDIRIDLYNKGLYWGSLIFEVKYRTIKNFWNSKESSCREQIRAYKNDISSPYCRGLDPDFSVRKMRPVDRVWVLNPTHSEGGIIDKRDEGIKFVQLIPGLNHREIVEELKMELDMAYDGRFL